MNIREEFRVNIFGRSVWFKQIAICLTQSVAKVWTAVK